MSRSAICDAIVAKAGAAGRGLGVGLAMPSASATLRASFSSTCARLSTMRWRIAGTSTLDSSKRKAAMMCSFSAGLWLLKNSARLGEVVVEARAAAPDLGRLDRFGEALEALAARRRRGTPRRWPASSAHRRPGRLFTSLAVHAVALEVVERAHAAVDRQLVEVGAAQARELRVGVREQPPLQQRIVAEVDAGHHVARMKGHLLGLGEEVVGVAVEHQPADALHRHHLFGNQLGRVEQVEAAGLSSLSSRDHLHAQLPLGEVALLDGFPQVAAMEVRVLAGDLLRLVPGQAVHAQLGLPVELDEVRYRPCALTKRKVWTPKPSIMRKLRGMARSRHRPHQHVRGLGHQRGEIPEGVVRAGRLRHLVVRLGLDAHGPGRGTSSRPG